MEAAEAAASLWPVNPTIVLVDDHEIVRSGLRRILEKQSLRVIGEAGDGESAVRLARELHPDIVLMDIGLPRLNGIDATRQIRGDPGSKVIALSVHSEGPIVRRMIEAGASAYLLKDCAGDELNRAIQSVSAGDVYLSPGLSEAVLRQLSTSETQQRSLLTPKEREVLALIAEGLTTKEIAQKLSVSPKTIDTHRQHLMDKLNIHSIAGLTRYAIRNGLAQLE